MDRNIPTKIAVLLPPLLLAALAMLVSACAQAAPSVPVVDSATLTGKVMAGYQGWFRCPGDGGGSGWVHWSTDPKRITGGTVPFDMWPDTSEYGKDELYPADGMTYPDGSQAYLYSALNAKTVLCHFQWMRDSGIDGVYLQQFVLALPGGVRPSQTYPIVMNNVISAAKATGRVWAVSYDPVGESIDRIYGALTSDWQQKVDSGVTSSPNYLHNNGKPVLNLWATNVTPELASKLIDYFKAPGKYGAFLVGGGNWNWRNIADPAWQAFLKRFDAYMPWNVGNFSKSANGDLDASTGYWDADRAAAQANGTMWIPTIYPAFSCRNIARLRHWPDKQYTFSRNGGKFFWNQWVKLAKMNQQTVFIAMFDEVDEGTAIYKVTNTPPTQGHFVTYDGYPSDWYLRLAQAGIRMVRGQAPITGSIPIKP